ncbi:hypothetical protein Tco_1088442 [Tanacetum coccineum]
MANLEFCDKHNMVAYLKKPTASEGFQEIADFLNGCHIRFALTKNPTIYVSLIEKFWQTTTVRTVDNGEQEITATVDGKESTITKASIRRHLQLANVEGISALSTTKIFDQLSLIGWKLSLRSGIDRVGIGEVVVLQGAQDAMGVKKLEKTLKSNQARRRAKIVVSDDEEDLEDSSKQGRMIEEIDQDAGVTLVTPTKDSSQEVSTVGINASCTAGYGQELTSKDIGKGNDGRIKGSIGRREQNYSKNKIGLDMKQLARVEADEELTQRLQAEERNKGAEVELDHEGSNKQKTNEASESVQEQPDEKEKEFPQQDLQFMLKPYKSNIQS